MQKGFFMPRIALAAALTLSLAACTTVSERVVLDPALTPPSGVYADEVAALRDYEYEGSREPLSAIEDIVREISGDPVRTKALADDLATMLLDPKATYWAKDFACRQLWVIGGPEHVPHIATLLEEPRTVDMACYALENINGPEADAALSQALANVRNDGKVSVLNALGNRAANRSIHDLRSVRRTIEPYRDARNVAVAAAAQDAFARLKR
jgi:hypothetical protein